MATENDNGAPVVDAPATPDTSASTPATSGQPAATPASTTGFSYQEDRSKWIPPHRFNEVNQRAQRTQQLEVDIAERDRKIAALAGVAPVDPNAQKSQQVKDAFFQMFPAFRHLANLSDQQMERLLRAPESADQVKEIETRYWRQQGDSFQGKVFSEVANAIGADSLSEDQKSDLQSSFHSWFGAKCRAELEASGNAASATLDRYQAQDPSLIADFVKRVTNNWVEPARRRVTQQTLTRTRPVPSSAGRSQVITRQTPETFKTLDERIEFGANRLKDEGFFGGR